jgi:large subunit ribosomal protein L29
VPQVKAGALREKSIEELRTQEQNLREQIFKLRFQRATGQAENPGRVRLVRKELARVMTVLHEKSGAEPAAAGTTPAGPADKA